MNGYGCTLGSPTQPSAVYNYLFTFISKQTASSSTSLCFVPDIVLVLVEFTAVCAFVSLGV